jgi:hypothetical protein
MTRTCAGTTLRAMDCGPVNLALQVTDYANSVSATSERVYVVGQTMWALPMQTSAGFYDVFVRKYDLAGNGLWTRQFGLRSTEDDIAFGVSATAGGVYVVGSTGGVLPGQSSAGDADISCASTTWQATNCGRGSSAPHRLITPPA